MRGAPLTPNSAVATRMQCVLTIPAGLLSHVGEHTHSKEAQPFHFCEMRYLFFAELSVAMQLT